MNKAKLKRLLIQQIHTLEVIFEKAETDEDLLDEDELTIYNENYDTEILRDFVYRLEMMKDTISFLNLFAEYKSLIEEIPQREMTYEMDRVCWEDISIANNFLIIEKLCLV